MSIIAAVIPPTQIANVILMKLGTISHVVEVVRAQEEVQCQCGRTPGRAVRVAIPANCYKYFHTTWWYPMGGIPT